MYKPKERFIVTSIMILVTLLITSNVFAAQRRLNENFDDRAIDPLLTTRIYGVWNITPPTFSWGAGRGGSGYSYGSGTNREAFLEWDFANTWYTDELYVSFWMRYPTFTNNYANENIKIFYPSFGSGGGDKVEVVAYGVNSIFACTYNNGVAVQPVIQGWGATGQFDGNWHRYEFYIKFSTATFKAWMDRPIGNYADGSYLKKNVTHGAGIWDNRINYITIGSIDGEAASTFTRFFDDVEVWDGMPNGSTTPPLVDTTPPARPSGVITTIIP